MNELKQAIADYSSQSLAQRKNWYSPAAEAYDKVRPRYPEALVNRVMELAQLSSASKLLEIGCGPATATTAFAQLGCAIVGLEPNPDFYRLAQHHCAPYTKVEICPTTFEEWPLEPEGFDAVLSASAFHWIPPEIGYAKAASALRSNGSLILLWNKELQPHYRVYQSLSGVYQKYAPSLDRYEEPAVQEDILNALGQMVIDSGQFNHLISEQVVSEVTYTIDEYLMLLNTYSPYLKLAAEVKESLFQGLRATLIQNVGDRIELFYRSAFHIAHK